MTDFSNEVAGLFWRWIVADDGRTETGFVIRRLHSVFPLLSVNGSMVVWRGIRYFRPDVEREMRIRAKARDGEDWQTCQKMVAWYERSAA